MSWIKRKPVNRRVGRIHVLDVKLRSDQVRRARLRKTGLALATLLGTVVGAFALWHAGQWAIGELVYSNSAFAIRTIEVHTDGTIVPDQLRRWANVRPGQNLLALDLARVKRDLQLSPALETVMVERILPHTLRIRVAEREPVLQVSVPTARAPGHLEAAIFYIGTDGVVMLPLDAKQRARPLLAMDDGLPQLSGLNLGEVRPGQRLASPAVQSALRLVNEFAYSPLAGLVDLRRIDVSAGDVIVVTTAQGSEVTLGFENLEQQLRRWRQIHDLGVRTHRNVASIDLSVSNNVPVRWLEANIVPPPAKPPKPIRNKKRNV